MAKILLGSIVTQIRGSVGGTAFKLQRGTQVMYRKSNGYSKNILLKNPALGYARYIFQNWSGLSDAAKTSWYNLAATIWFTDKFGNSVHITGRQLFTKLNLNLQGLDYFTSVPVGMSNVVNPIGITSVSSSVGANTISVAIDNLLTSDLYCLVSAELSPNPLGEPVFNKRKTLKTQFISTSVSISFGTEFFAQFPFALANYNVRVYVTPMNEYGFKGQPVSFLTTLGS